MTIFGHVSARIDDKRFLITPRASPALARADTLLVMDVDGNLMSGADQPNSEFWIHAGIYRARPSMGGIAHIHGRACVVLGQLGHTVRAISNGAAFLGDIAVHDDPAWITTRELGDEIAAQLGERSALLLRAHGAVTTGDDVRAALTYAANLEELAELNLRALAAAGGRRRARALAHRGRATARTRVARRGPAGRASVGVLRRDRRRQALAGFARDHADVGPGRRPMRGRPAPPDSFRGPGWIRVSSRPTAHRSVCGASRSRQHIVQSLADSAYPDPHQTSC